MPLDHHRYRVSCSRSVRPQLLSREPFAIPHGRRWAQMNPKPTPTAQEKLPFGIPVPGKPGLVYSPYAKEKIIDVSGYKHGQLVLCPYTARKFRVP